MTKEYISFRCRKCYKTTIILNHEIVRNRFCVCFHCSSKDITKENEVNSLKECMQHASYKRMHGAIRQVR